MSKVTEFDDEWLRKIMQDTKNLHDPLRNCIKAGDELVSKVRLLVADLEYSLGHEAPLNEVLLALGAWSHYRGMVK